MSWVVYRLLLAAVFPWLLFDAWRRWRRAPANVRRLFMQFGRLPDHLPQGGIWLHAVSLGEVRAATSLIAALQARWPDLPLVVSTTTETGARAARAAGVRHFYAPYDYRWVMRRILRRLQPRLVIVMETELWPNWVAAAAERGVPVAIVNARLSDRSYRAYRRFGGRLLQGTLAQIALICAQSEADRDRFVRLMAGEARGGKESHVADCGNLKFDLQCPAVRPWALPVDRRAWLAASTHEGEESQVLDAHGRLRSAYPDALLVLVPRHPERADAVQALVERAGLRLQRYSALSSSDHDLAPETDVLLIDQTGVLMPFFAAVPVVFMGGSLVSVGGHNPIEPAIFGRAVISGTEVRNFRAVYGGLRSVGGVRMIAEAAELAPAVRQAWDDPEGWSAVGWRAEAMVAENRGSTERVVERLGKLLR